MRGFLEYGCHTVMFAVLMHPPLLIAMGSILLTWALLALFLAGLGRFLFLPFRQRIGSADGFLLSIWIGFGLTISFLQVWHFFAPVGTPALLCLGAISLVGLLVYPKETVGQPFRFVYRRPILLIAILLLGIWLSNRAIGPADAHDSGLYHLQAIRWTETYPLVRGLGNLDQHFAFNNSSFLYDALLDAGPWHGRGTHLANGFLMLLLFAQVAIGFSLFARDDHRNIPALFDLILLVPAMALVMSKQVASPTTDLPQAVLSFVTASLTVKFLLRAAAPDDAQQRSRTSAVGSIPFLATAILLLAATAVCLKISAIFFSTAVAILCLGVLLFRRRSGEAHVGRAIMVGGILCLLLLIPWLVRGAVLSGYVLPPATVFPIAKDWRMPAAMLDDERSNIRTWARIGRGEFITAVGSKIPWLSWILPVPSELPNPNSMAWIPTWCIDTVLASPVEIALPLAITAIAGFGILRARLRHMWRGLSALSLLLLIAALCAVIWFIEAPEPRFGLFIVWILAGVTVCIAVRHAPRFDTPLWRRRVIAAAMCSAALPILYRMAILKMHYHEPMLSALVLPAGPDHGFHPPPPFDIESYRTRHDLILNVPTNAGLPFNAPLPATHFPQSDLRLRTPGNLADGFALDTYVTPEEMKAK